MSVGPAVRRYSPLASFAHALVWPGSRRARHRTLESPATIGLDATNLARSRILRAYSHISQLFQHPRSGGARFVRPGARRKRTTQTRRYGSLDGPRAPLRSSQSTQRVACHTPRARL